MTEAFGILALVIIGGLVMLFNSSSRNRAKDLEQELEDWEGVTDVRRKTRDNLANPDYVKRVQDKFND